MLKPQIHLRLLLCLVALSVGEARSESGSALLPERPIGYGAGTRVACQSGDCVCEVTDGRDYARDAVGKREPAIPGTLRWCLEERRGSRRVKFRYRGEIHLKASLLVPGDTWIDGRPAESSAASPVTITGEGLHLFKIRDSSNVIVSDLQMHVIPTRPACQNPTRPKETAGCGGAILIDGDAKHIWINQNKFTNCGGKCVNASSRGSVGGEPVGADLITISGNRFEDSFFAIRLGGENALPNAKLPPMRVSIYGNYFLNILRRSPRAASFSQVHVFNNVMKNWGPARCPKPLHSWASSTVGEARLLLENNLYEARPEKGACKTALQIGPENQKRTAEPRQDGFAWASGNVLKNGAVLRPPPAKGEFDPKRPYEIRPKEMTDALQSQIEEDSGPRITALP